MMEPNEQVLSNLGFPRWQSASGLWGGVPVEASGGEDLAIGSTVTFSDREGRHYRGTIYAIDEKAVYVAVSGMSEMLHLTRTDYRFAHGAIWVVPFFYNVRVAR